MQSSLDYCCLLYYFSLFGKHSTIHHHQMFLTFSFSFNFYLKKSLTLASNITKSSWIHIKDAASLFLCFFRLHLRYTSTAICNFSHLCFVCRWLPMNLFGNVDVNNSHPCGASEAHYEVISQLVANKSNHILPCWWGIVRKSRLYIYNSSPHRTFTLMWYSKWLLPHY